MLITLTRTQRDIRIDLLMPNGDPAESRPILHDNSLASLRLRLVSYGFSHSEIDRAIKTLEEKGEVDLSPPLTSAA